MRERFRKQTSAMLVVILALVLLSGCGKKADDPYAGYYKAVSMSVAGFDMDADPETNYVEILGNGKIKVCVEGTKASGKYKVEDGGAMTVTIQGEDYEGMIDRAALMIDFEGMEIYYKNDDYVSSAKEYFPDAEGVLDALKSVQDGTATVASAAAAPKKEDVGGGEAPASGETPASGEAEGGSASNAAIPVGLIADITDTIKSPDDVYGEDVKVNDAFGNPHDAFISAMEGYSDSSTYEWSLTYNSDDSTSFTTNVTGDKLDYAGLYYFGVETEELSLIMTVTDKLGDQYTLIGTFLYDEDGMYWMYWTTDGIAYSAIYDPMEGAFEGYSDGTVTVGGKTYKLGDNLTLIPN